MGKLNCWEYKKCGKEPGGNNRFGVCPAAIDTRMNGVHGGRNAGRACWMIAGSMSGTKIVCPEARKMKNCRRCDFMNVVKAAEERGETGFFATRRELERALQRDEDKKLVHWAVHDGAENSYQMSRERIDLVKSMIRNMLGPKSTRLIVKIDELHARYGERCCEQIDDLDEIARIFYGSLVAKNLREEIGRIVRNPAE